MPSARIKNKHYYAVAEGRIDEPTIFSSWGDAHPRVTCCSSIFKSFKTIGEAREYLRNKGASQPKEIIKDGAEETNPVWNSTAFYAVAYGRRSGITEFCGDKGSELEVDEFPGACHKKFRTRAQAEAFIEDWKQSFADIYCREIKKKLDQGFIPRNILFDVEGILNKSDDETRRGEIPDNLEFSKLKLT